METGELCRRHGIAKACFYRWKSKFGGLELSEDQGDRLKPATVHQEFRVLRRMLNVSIRKKLLAFNPCAGVEFPMR